MARAVAGVATARQLHVTSQMGPLNLILASFFLWLHLKHKLPTMRESLAVEKGSGSLVSKRERA